jgi:alpha-beta hydrolase superfamily lysophospholipase
VSAFTNSGERVEGASGPSIFFRSVRPKEKPRAVVIIVPGFNAHSGYYAWVAEQFVATGLAVYAVDLRGRGNSDGERFYVDNFEDYASDVEAVVQVARSRESNSPFFSSVIAQAGLSRASIRLITNPNWMDLSATASPMSCPPPISP